MAARFTSTIKPSASSKIATDNIHIIWLDNHIDSNRQLIQDFHTITNSVQTLTKPDQCVQLLQNLSNEKVYLILPGGLGREIVPIVHDLSQIDSILIFCTNKEYHEQWVKAFPKIQGVFTRTTLLCERLKQLIEQKTPPSANSGEFVYTEILLEILCSIDFTLNLRKDFLAYVRRSYYPSDEQKFEKEYRQDKAVEWYFNQSFLYELLNRALMSKDVHLISLMGFYIVDLHRDIQLKSEKNSKAIGRVYRFETRSKSELDRLTNENNGYFSFNRFFSAQLRPPSSRQPDPNSIGILFTINLSSTTTPFALIDNRVLFSLNTFFKIHNLQRKSSNFYEIELNLLEHRNADLQVYFDHFRKEIIQRTNPWYQLALLCLRINPNEVCNYECIFKQLSNEDEKVQLASQIGLIYMKLKQYEQARDYLEKSLSREQSPKNQALVINQLAFVHQQLNAYPQALSYYQTLLKIYDQMLPSNHPDLSSTYFNLGVVSRRLNQNAQALSYHQKAWDIRQNTLPPNHPDLIASKKELESLSKKN